MQKSGDYSHFPEMDNISDCSKATHLIDTRRWVAVDSFPQSWSQWLWVVITVLALVTQKSK